MSFAHETEEQGEMMNPSRDPSPNVDKLIDEFKEMAFSIFKLHRRCGDVRPYYGELESLYHFCYMSRIKVTYEQIANGIELAKQELEVQLLHGLNIVSIGILLGKDEVRDAQLLFLSLIHRFVQTGSNY
jgi:hypothetical protein